MSSDDTAASEHGVDAETAAVPQPIIEAPELAWSADDDDDIDEAPTNRRGRLTWAGLTVLVVAVTAALLLLVSTLFERHHSNTTKRQPTPSPLPTSSSVATTPAPPTMSVRAAPEPPVYVPPPPSHWSAPPVFTSADNQFLAELRSMGIDLPTANAAKYAIDNAHNACNYLAAHPRPETVTYVQRLTMWRDQESASKFVTSAQLVYCPQLL